jgi:hypothetical protein
MAPMAQVLATTITRTSMMIRIVPGTIIRTSIIVMIEVMDIVATRGLETHHHHAQKLPIILVLRLRETKALLGREPRGNLGRVTRNLSGRNAELKQLGWNRIIRRVDLRAFRFRIDQTQWCLEVSLHCQKMACQIDLRLVRSPYLHLPKVLAGLCRRNLKFLGNSVGICGSYTCYLL